MLFVRKRKRIIAVVLLIVFSFSSKVGADENLQVSDDNSGQGSDASVTVKAQDSKSDESEQQPTNIDDKNENSKLEKNDQPAPQNTDVKNENFKSENSVHTADTKSQKDQAEDGDVQSEAQDEKSEDAKSEEQDHASGSVDIKKQKEEDNHKTNLNDVNAFTADENSVKAKKRETSYSEFVGMPRDASYFFDDLEPFINNNSDNRVGRAAPIKETKSQKSKLNGKGRETVEDDVDEDDEDSENEEDNEKENEDDYDEDEDADSDCMPSTETSCGTTTSTCPTTTSTCKTTHVEHTTEVDCKTTTEKASKCPKMCAKANRKAIGYPVTPPKDFSWDTDKRKLNINKKRRHHNRVNSGN